VPGEGEIDWQEPRKFDCQFSQVFGEWPENQILISDWTYFHCPDATLARFLLRLSLGWR